LVEARICGGDTREEAGGKGRGQAGGTKTSEGTDLRPAGSTTWARVVCPSTEERADEETPAEASKRELRRRVTICRGGVTGGVGGTGRGSGAAARRGGFGVARGTSGTGSGGKVGSGAGRRSGVVGGKGWRGWGRWITTHLATLETAER
jgi:hypothetical protein